MNLSNGLALGAAAVLAAGSAHAVTFNHDTTAVADLSTLGVGSSLVALDISTYQVSPTQTLADFGVAPGSNSYSVDFESAFTGFDFNGTFTVELYGNQSSIGPGLSSVLWVYTLTDDDSDSQVGLENVTAGIDGGSDLNFTYINNGTQGRVTAGSTPAQASPTVELTQNTAPTNDLWTFDFGSDALGQFSAESYQWYLLAGADTPIGFADWELNNLGDITVQMLAPIDIDGQDNLDVPGPGSVALVGLAGLAAARRRRA